MVALILGCVVGAIAGIGLVWWRRRVRDRRVLDAYSVDAEGLYRLLNPERSVMVFDVRQPLDLLAHSEVIPGAVRIAPKEVLENPMLVPKEKDVVLYCTCPGEKTSRSILRRVLELDFTRVKILRGGFDGWKAKGYPVERYEKSFRLDGAG